MHWIYSFWLLMAIYAIFMAKIGGMFKHNSRRLASTVDAQLDGDVTTKTAWLVGDFNFDVKIWPMGPNQ